VRVFDSVVATTVAIALVAGIVEYHHVLDPPRSERNGVTMNLLVDRGNGAVPNDWFSIPGVQVAAGGGVLRIAPRKDGWGLESRIVRLYADDCYRVVVRAAASGGTAVLAAGDAELTRVRAYAPLPRTMARSTFLVAPRAQELTLAIAATGGTHVTLAAARVDRLSRSCATPRSGRDIGRLLDQLAHSHA
jgi:hypothetical protein